MFYITARVGSMFAVYDNGDNSVEWYDKSQLLSYANMGVQISGLSKNGVSLHTNLQCSWHSCNWTKSKKNIFDVAERVQKSGDTITIFAEGKKYKCKILDYNNTVCHVVFSNGLNVSIPMSWLEQFI